MAQATNPTMTDSVKSFGNEVKNAGRKLYLFGRGALEVACEGCGEMFERMVARGEAAEKKSAEERSGIVHKASDSAREVGRYVEKKFQGTVSGTLARAGVPSRSDVRDLIARVEELAKQVEALSEDTPAEPPLETDQ